MPPQVRQVLQALLEQWQRLGRTQRLLILALGGVLLVLIVAVAVTTTGPQYTTIYRNLSEQDAAAIVARLREQRIPFEVAENGTAIRVPADRAHEIRLQLAAQGLPQGGMIGYEIFDRPGLGTLGMTEFTQRLNYQRALEGELSRTISRLDPVESARVHLALPQPALLTERQREPTAAVVLKLRPGRSLEPRQVMAIQHLVSHSVEGLKPENVTVVTVEGEDLTDLGLQGRVQRPDTTLTRDQIAVQRQVERTLERNIVQMLEQALGPNRAVVRVTVNLNWDQVQREAEVFAPAQAGGQPSIVRSQQQTRERFSGPPGTLPGGIPGVSSNVGPGPQTVPGGTAGPPVQFEKEDVVTNYEVSKAVERLIKAPGSVERISVAVMLDGPMDEAQVQAIERTVAAAAGVKPERGDVVTVTALPFNRAAMEQQARALEEAQRLEFYYNLAKIAAAVLIAVLVLLLVRSLLRRPVLRRPALPGEEVSALPTGERARPLTRVEVPEVPSAEEERLRALEQRLREAEERRRIIQEHVESLARSQPEAVADLLRTWLEEEETRPPEQPPEPSRNNARERP